MGQLGNGLFEAGYYEDALSVEEAELSMERRLGASEESILVAQSNLAATYRAVGRHEEALRMRRDVYSGTVKLNGKEHAESIVECGNLVINLLELQRFEEAKRLLRNVIPVARRVLGNEHSDTLSLCEDLSRATLLEAADGDSSAEEVHEALRALEDTLGVMRRVLGPQHPDTQRVQENLEAYREEFPTTA